ncbi:MAG: nucleotide exchange factor GrpE [Desulfacinum sp.]|nr:nucleotide exchange factor GrpE [Desulfacinum sp.]
MSEERKPNEQMEESGGAVNGQEPGQTSKPFDPDTATVDEWKALLAEKEAEIAALKDKLLRQAAEMENTRKRLERERTEAITFANENLLRELLTVIDNLERAIQHAEQEAENQQLLEGVKMTHKQFLDTLARFGCKPFESKGKDFDPCYHEAILQQETNDHPANSVVQEFQKGYMLHDRLLRPAMVAVAKGSRTAGPDEADAEESRTGGTDTAH